MTRQIVALVVISMVLSVAVQAHPGRKLQQVSQQTGSRSTAAQADTAARINAAIDNNVHVKPSEKPKGAPKSASVTTKPSTGSGTVTSAIADAPKGGQGFSQNAGVSTAAQAVTGAKISEAAASGTTPTKPTVAPGSKPTTVIASTPKSTQGSGGAKSTAAQSATAAAINQYASGAKPATKP